MVIFAIFGVLLVTIFGLICLVRDLQARLSTLQKEQVGQQTMEFPPISISDDASARPTHHSHEAQVINSASKLAVPNMIPAVDVESNRNLK